MVVRTSRRTQGHYKKTKNKIIAQRRRGAEFYCIFPGEKIRFFFLRGPASLREQTIFLVPNSKS